MPHPPLRIGTAGWSVPRDVAAAFPPEGSTLARYAARFDAAEINSSFYRPHRPATYARWADTVPDTFRFAVKLPKTVTHERRLVDIAAPLDRFLTDIAALGPKLGPLLVQLPPSLRFEADLADTFLKTLRTYAAGMAYAAGGASAAGVASEAAIRCEIPVVCEPRHASWFTPEADALLAAHRVARVAADPAPVPEAARPGGWSGLRYHRLHGAPRMYGSPYEPPALDALADGFAARSVETWCVFDNTASGAAAANALALVDRMALRPLEFR